MASKLGSTDVSFRLGATTPAAVYLGSEQVWSAVTVPGAPTITSATSDSIDIYVYYDAPESDGGSAILSYKVYIDGQDVTSFAVSSPGFIVVSAGGVGSVAEVSAVNAIGEGPKSAPFTVTAA